MPGSTLGLVHSLTSGHRCRIWTNDAMYAPFLLSAILWSQVAQVQGFIGVMRVDGSAFQWLGTETADIANFSTISGLSLTPTQTTLKATAGGVEATIHFTSPIEPSDLALHSFPFTYVHIDVRSVDGASHRVQFYTDVTGEWISNSFTTPVRWSTTQTTEGSVYHQMKAQSPKSMIEAANIAEDSEIYIGTSMVRIHPC